MNRNSFIVAGIPIASPHPKDMDGICYDGNIKQWVFRQMRDGVDGVDGSDGRDGRDGADGRDGMDGCACTCSGTETVYFTNAKHDLKKGDDLMLNIVCSTFREDNIFLVGSDTVKISREGFYEVTFSAGRNEFGILAYKGSNFTFLLKVGPEGVDLKCTMLSMAKLIDENSCTLKIVRVQ